MRELKRADAFSVVFADSFASKKLKIVERRVHIGGAECGKGRGEKRIYVGHDERVLDTFFGIATTPTDTNATFFVMKEDLKSYYEEAQKELLNPHYQFGETKEVKSIFRDYKERLDGLMKEKLFFHFTKTYDVQKRYYLVLYRTKEDVENYNFIREICLPRISKLLFMKLYDEVEKRFYINVKPVIEYGVREGDYEVSRRSKVSTKRSFNRDGQERYREAVFNHFNSCVVTQVSDPDLLEACHIKDYAHCTPKERVDGNNGFIMTPTIHKLFDLGYLSFKESGEMILSNYFRNMDKKRLHLDGTIRISLNEGNKEYLRWHNTNIFKNVTKGVFNI